MEWVFLPADTSVEPEPDDSRCRCSVIRGSIFNAMEPSAPSSRDCDVTNDYRLRICFQTVHSKHDSWRCEDVKEVNRAYIFDGVH